MYKDSKGYYYLAGEYHPDNRDDGSLEYGRFRKRFGDRNVKMLEQAIYDGEDCVVAIPSENGAGKGEFEELVKMFSEAGFKVRGMVTGNSKGAKIERFSAFSSAAQNGMVYILRDTFNEETYNALMKEMEAFDGTPSTSQRKDDFLDAVSDSYLALQKVKVHKAFSLPSHGSPTALSQHRQRIK
jgi:predicted phage terminase large subunit-like protein